MLYEKTEAYVLEEAEHISEMIARLTKKGMLMWEYVQRYPMICLSKEDENYYSQTFIVKSEFNQWIINLEITDVLYLCSERGDMRLSLSLYRNEEMNYVFCLSDYIEEQRKKRTKKQCVRWKNTAIVRMSNILFEQIDEMEIVDNCTRQRPVTQKYLLEVGVGSPVVAFLDALIQKNRLLDFHRCMLDKRYRNILIDEFDTQMLH